MKVEAKEVWGDTIGGILLTSKEAMVLHMNKGIAEVHIDISKEDAKALILSLQKAIESVEKVEATLNENGNWGDYEEN